MNLLTKAILRDLPALYSQESKKPHEVKVVVKYFNPYGAGTWYVTEGETVLSEKDPTPGGDYMFFGLAKITDAELGYFMLSELRSLKKFGRPQIERDLHWKGTLADAMRAEGLA